MDEDDYKVSSEIYEEFDYTAPSKPKVNDKNAVSKFIFKYPQYIQMDADGDFILPRRHSKEDNIGVIEIEHSKSTVLGLVGLQVWRGSLLLADWLLDNAKCLPSDSYILELGSGVGLTSIVAAMHSPVICTDVDKGDILELIRNNLERNKDIVKHSTKVCELDFKKDSIPAEIEKHLEKTSLILAADVVYDDQITKAFIKILQKLMRGRSKMTAYIALEKRYVFTIADCDTVAPCYEYFLELLQTLKGVKIEEVPLTFPQYFQYNRVKELALWKIACN